MQRCPDPGCGHLNKPSARFCERCGHALRFGQWSPLLPGQTMHGGAYRVLHPLGRGGMGALYLAADRGAFDRRCVIKELLDYYDPTHPEEARRAQARFEREARLLAELSHPGIPRIYSYFSEAGRHYIVMEYIEGDTLQEAVTHEDAAGRAVPARPLPPEEIVRHAIRVCRVLEYLASQPTPVIHHDIKPENLIVDQTSGEVRLVDFGTAHTRTPWAAQTRRQGAGPSIFGTEGYAAPEQFQGKSEPRSDVYALAATVYHLLTDDDPAEHPFKFSQWTTVPAPLADALGRALRTEVRRRSTAIEFRQALEAWLIPEAAAEPFVFRDGAAAHTTLDLATLCEQRWAESRQHLADGDFDRWFLARNRHDLLAKARSARLDGNTDAALEAFLRRLNPRLPRPRLVVQPPALSFGRVRRGQPAIRQLEVSNEGRGYGQATFSASVPWIGFDPPKVGCLAGERSAVNVSLDAIAIPLRRGHQAVIACTSDRGVRISIPVDAELDLAAIAMQRMLSWLSAAAHLVNRGARWGFAAWTRMFGSLLRSRYGLWILTGEALVLAVAMLALWWNWRGLRLEMVRAVLGFLVALSLALLTVYLIPALAFMAVGVGREAVQSVQRRGLSGATATPTQGKAP
jgi:serine/threonine protein kinase